MIRSPFRLLSFFLQHYHSMLYLLPLQFPMVGRILDHVAGHTNIGRYRNFIHLVTGHTPGRINRNGTVHSKARQPNDSTNKLRTNRQFRGLRSLTPVWFCLGKALKEYQRTSPYVNARTSFHRCLVAHKLRISTHPLNTILNSRLQRVTP